MDPALHVVSAGRGPRILLIHGSATDHSTWSIQLASEALRDRFTLVAYDRRSTALTVEAHADDARALLGGDDAIVVGSSFGAVIALELVRRHGGVRGAVLIEPPMAATDAVPEASMPRGRAPAPPAEPAGPPPPGDSLRSSSALLAAYDRTVAERGGPAAAELFLRTVLGDAAYARMPRAYKERAHARWADIRADSAALIAYRPRYAELAAVDVPVLLLGGARSASYFRPTLDALAAALPRARLEIVPGAGHMLHAEAHRRFAELLTAFALAPG